MNVFKMNELADRQMERQTFKQNSVQGILLFVTLMEHSLLVGLTMSGISTSFPLSEMTAA